MSRSWPIWAAGKSLVAPCTFGSWASWVPKGFVGCIAYLGGRGEQGQTTGEARAFLVPVDEYDSRTPMGS